MIKDEVLRFFAGKSALVTGGTGLIGRQIVDILCMAGARVRIASLDKVKVHEQADHVLGDLTDFGFCLDITKDIDLVFHIAGIKASVSISETKLASHFVPTLMMNTNMLEACLRNRVHRVVYTSSVGAYASAEVFRESEYNLASIPMDFAGWAKRIAELQVHAYHKQYGLTNFAVVRPSNVYGPGDNFDPANAMVIPSIMHRIHSGENPVMIWGDGSAIRDFVYSRDLAEGCLLALYHGTRGEFVNLGSGIEVSIRELIETLHGFIKFNYEFDPSKPTGFPRRLMDISRAREWIDYNPTTSLEQGLRLTWEWFLANTQEFQMKHNYFLEEKKVSAV